MSESLGTKLRLARENKGWTIEQLAAVTKLNLVFIEALENGRWDLLPGRVYLKSFAKVCAEALDLDLKEVYEKIDGMGPVEGKKPEPIAAVAASVSKRKVDYKLPLILGALVVVVILIIVAVRSNRTNLSDNQSEEIIPARWLYRRAEVKWERPWERPPQDYDFYLSNRLTIEADAGGIWACIVADHDTVFKGIMKPQIGRVFTADSIFRVTLLRNDRISAYLNGVIVKEIGDGGRRIYDYPIFVAGRDKTSDEIK